MLAALALLAMLAALAELAAQVGPVVRKELLAFVIQLKVPFLEQQAAEA